jgi:hypothetical protein
MHKKHAAPHILGLMNHVVGKGLGSFVNAPYKGSIYAANCSFKFDPIIKRTVIFAIKDWHQNMSGLYKKGIMKHNEILL